jgi:hypothetical protein
MALRFGTHGGTDISVPTTFQVLAHLASVPRLTAKLQCSLFRRQAAGLMKDATAALQCVQAACTQVRVITISDSEGASLCGTHPSCNQRNDLLETGMASEGAGEREAAAGAGSSAGGWQCSEPGHIAHGSAWLFGWDAAEAIQSEGGRSRARAAHVRAHVSAVYSPCNTEIC